MAEKNKDVNEIQTLQFLTSQLANKIALYGSNDVVISLAPVMIYLSHDTALQTENVTNLMCKMREDVGDISNNKINGAIHDILYKRM